MVPETSNCQPEPEAGASSSSASSRHAWLTRLEPSAEDRPTRQPGWCLGQKKDGGVCRATPTGDGYCPRHSPRYNADQRRQWSLRGAQSLHRRLVRAHTAVVQQIAAVAPQLAADVPLPPVPDPAAPDWSDATKIREYLQDLARKVATGTLPVSVAEMLRKLAESTLKVVDLEMDAEVMGHLDGDDDAGA